MSESKSTRPRWTRRGFCSAGAATAAAAYGLRPARGACRRSCRSSSTARSSSSPRPSRTRSGRRAALRHHQSRPPHFDVHQSGTINNLGTQGCMFDNLIRRDPRDSGKTIIPDLAHSWEIAKDGKTYTFHLRKGVQFHDGAELTVGRRQGDLRPHRQAAAGRQHPAQRRCSRRSSEINAPDKYTVRVQALRAAPGQLHDGGDRQRLERHRPQEDAGGQQLQSAQGRRTSPAPARSRRKRRVENEVWVMEKNTNYWNKGLPYLDGIEFYHAAAVLARTRLGDPVGPRRLRPHRRSGDRAQGEGDAGHVDHRIQPERHPGHLDQQQEEAVRRSAGAPRHASRASTGRCWSTSSRTSRR